MLTVYKNQEDLLKSTSTQLVSRLETVDRELLDVRNFAVTFKQSQIPNLELHVYTPDGVYLTGNHKANFSVENNDTTSQKVAYQHISINTVSELETVGITRGQYRLVYNLFDNVLGAFDTQKAFIKEISPSRQELRIQLADYENTKLVDQLFNLKSRWETLTRNDIFDSFVLNFGFNETYQIVNIKFIVNETATPELVVKLYEPLPSQYLEKAKVWISEEIIVPQVELVSVIPEHIPDEVNTLAAPNFDLEFADGGSIATDYKSWNDLLANNVSTSQQLIDTYFSGSLSGIKLNINYRDFSNFVQYSSATERVKNFKYKLELIEHFNSQIDIISSAPTSSILDTSLLDLYAKRNRVVSGYDDFEKYLFFGTAGSKLYTHFDSATGSIEPWPKVTINNLTWLDAYQQWQNASMPWNSTYFNNFSATTSTSGSIYYKNLLAQAEDYDKYNVHKLLNTIPLHIQNAADGDQFTLFVNMIAQHFDIIWTYINNLTSTKTREEHPKDGMSDDLLYHVASSMGFNLLNGNSTSDLWKYALGVDDAGNPDQDAAVTGITSLSHESTTKEIWRRIVNNLPYILKSKGTSRSIKALLTCFGIPSTVLTIKEYGGPSTFTDADHFPEYVHDVYHKAWNANELTTISLPGNNLDNGTGTLVSPNTLEFRFKTDNNYTYQPLVPYHILSSNSIYTSSSLYIAKLNDYNNLGTIIYNEYDVSSNTAYNIEIPDLEIFDNSWHLITIDLSNDGYNDVVTVKAAKSLYGKAIYIISESMYSGVTPFFSDGKAITFGAENSYGSAFKGHIEEIRLWSGSLSDLTLQEHAASPNTYTYNNDINALVTGDEAAAPFRHLLQRFPISDSNIKDGNYFYSSHPNQTINISGSVNQAHLYVSSPSNFVLEGFESTYYTPSPSLGGAGLYTNKVRIESSSLDSNKVLNTQTRIEKSSYDRYSLDSNRLGVYFSPQTQINEDIFNQLGYFEIDDYIGDPEDTYKEHYTELTNFAIQYWKKYENRNDFEAYFRALEIYDFTLFKYIKQLLPHRTNAVLGLVVEPNVLERSRVRLNRKPTIEDLTHETVIAQFDLSMYMDAEDINSIIDDDVISPVIDYDADKLGEVNQLIVMPSIDYDDDRQAELNFIQINPNIDYDDINIGELPGVILQPNIDYDSYKLALLNDINPSFSDSKIIKSLNGTILNEDTNPTLTDSKIIKSKDGTISRKLTSSGNISSIPRSTINTKIDDVDKLGTSWIQNRYIGINKLKESGSYTPVQKVILNSRASDTLQKLNYFYSSAESASLQRPYSASYSASEINRDPQAGWRNARYNGCKLTAAAINVNSSQTVDGGPVVKVTKVNPNKIVFANGQLTTIDEATTGIRKKSI